MAAVRVCSIHVGLAHAPAPMSLVLFAWLATNWDAFSRYRMWLASWLAGWSNAGHVCLSDSDATCARDQRKLRSRETIVLYPLKWTNNRLHHPLWRHQPTNFYPARKYMGLIIGHYLHKYLHQIHQNWLFKSRNCTHFGDNRGRAQIHAIAKNHGIRRKTR